MLFNKEIIIKRRRLVSTQLQPNVKLLASIFIIGLFLTGSVSSSQDVKTHPTPPPQPTPQLSVEEWNARRGRLIKTVPQLGPVGPHEVIGNMFELVHQCGGSPHIVKYMECARQTFSRFPEVLRSLPKLEKWLQRTNEDEGMTNYEMMIKGYFLEKRRSPYEQLRRYLGCRQCIGSPMHLNAEDVGESDYIEFNITTEKGLSECKYRAMRWKNKQAGNEYHAKSHKNKWNAFMIFREVDLDISEAYPLNGGTSPAYDYHRSDKRWKLLVDLCLEEVQDLLDKYALGAKKASVSKAKE